MFMSTESFCAAATIAFSTCGALAATSNIQLDLQSLRAHSFDITGAPAPFGGLTHSGSVVLSNGSASTFAGISLNGVPQAIAPGQLQSFSGSIDLGLGTVLGGSMSLILNNGDAFSAQITSGVGGVSAQPGQGFSIDGLYFGALFSTSTFGGVNISSFFNAQPLDGSFLTFGLNPILVANGDGDGDPVDLSITLVPAAPAAATLGIGLAGLAARRRQR